MIVTILAGGYSALACDLRSLPGTVIAVNDSMVYAPRWDVGVSMDRLWAENRIEQIRKTNKTLWLRRSTVKNFVVTEDEQTGCRPDRFRCVLFDNDHESTVLASAPYTLNGTHSGFCALNLAYHWRPDKIYLVGFDLKLGPRGERHWYPPYEWKNGGGSGAGKLAEWAGQFRTAQRQLAESRIDVYLVSEGASVKGFNRIHPKDL